MEIKKKIFGSILFVIGLFSFALGLVFLDLASLSIKNDLYTLTVLGKFNNFFSLKPPFVNLQTALSTVFIHLSALIAFIGVTLIVKEKR